MSNLNVLNIERSDVPDNIWNATVGLTDRYPPTSPAVLLKVAEWWYSNGRGGNDPVFRYTIENLNWVANKEISKSCRRLYDTMTLYLEDIDASFEAEVTVQLRI